MLRKVQWAWRSLIAVMLTGLIIITAITLQPSNASMIAPLPDPYLTTGKLSEGEKVLSDYLQANPKDDKTRFGLGIIQLMRGTERLMQSLYGYGMAPTPLSAIPFVRLPIPSNPKPQTVTYDGLQQLFQAWIDDLSKVRSTLEPIQDQNLKLALRLGLIRLDFDGNGKVDKDEMLWQVFNAVTGERVTEQQAQQFLIAFDLGDALWLQGYTHVLGAIAEFLRTYDSRELFAACAHLFFQNVDTPHKFLLTSRHKSPDDYSNYQFEFFDLISAIHLAKFPLAEPQRMMTILNHLKSVIRLSRESWKSILAETDNDREWLPNPNQKSVIPDVRITDNMIKSWFKSLDETALIIDGKKNLPFWRDSKLTLDFMKIFTEPRAFDLVSWVQGTAATPYLEKGTVTDMSVWTELLNAFGSNLFNFVVWFN